MVSFICDACGNTVKKTQVEKHYMTACRNCSVLSCLDCGVDFPGDSYLNHTSCVTEAEKYQGHLYQAKDKENKGETKQKEWLKNVHGTSGQTADPKLRSLLKKLSAYSNIPRKKKKFDNFCKNSVNVYDAKTLDQLWDLFTGGNDANAGKPSDAGGGGADDCVENGTAFVVNGTACVENGTASVEDDIECKENKESEEELSIPDVAIEPEATADIEHSTKKKKKKKKKQIECETLAVKENVENSCVTDECGEETVAKKKRKKKKITECNGVSQEGVTTNAETNEQPVVEPKKKKKKKEMEVTTEILVESQQLTKKSKKSKKKHDVNETDDTNTVISDSETKRKLGRKAKKKDTVEEPECNLNEKLEVDGENGEEDAEEPTPVGKFNWHRTIKQILKESEDGELSLKKLQKKVLSAYQAHGVDHRASTVNEAMALCDKKIKSYPKAKITKDRVKLTK